MLNDYRIQRFILPTLVIKMDVSSNGPTPANYQTFDHFSIESHGFGDPPFPYIKKENIGTETIRQKQG